MNHPKSLYTHKSENNFKTFLLMTSFLILVIGIGFFLSVYFDNPSLLVFAVIGSIIANITSYWFSDKIVLKMAHAKEAKKEEYYELYTLVENLSITAGLPMPKVYVIEDPVPNAFATGRNKEHAVVAFTTGILGILNKTELEGVVAHELAHIGNKDILIQTVVVVLVGMISLVADFFLRVSFHGGNRQGGKGGGPLMLIGGIILIIIAPLIATVLQLAISRKREFAADATGALLTRYPEGLASALEKIEVHAGTMRHANHATAHLYISNPLRTKGNKKGFFSSLFRTHPHTHERVQALRGERF